MNHDIINNDNKELYILGENIPPNSTKILNFKTAKLHTHTQIEIPVIVSRGKLDGPTILISSGIHGDEINGIDIVRKGISKKLFIPRKGCVICVPVVNVFGFLQQQRYFPDGRDLNRVFPGSKRGSLASRLAHYYIQELLLKADLCIDFHTGGRSLYNAAQIRIQNHNHELLELACIFNAPFTVYSNQIKGSYRSICDKYQIPCLLFEGGKSENIDPYITSEGLKGILNILSYLEMLNEKGQNYLNKLQTEHQNQSNNIIEKTTWIRAKSSGLFHPKIQTKIWVNKGETLGYITDPYGNKSIKIKAPNNGYIITLNESAIVYQGDAIIRISKPL